MSKRRAETWPGRVRRSLVAFRSPAAGRMPKPACRVRRSLAAGRVPKPGRAPVTARRGPARRRDRNGKDGLDDGRDHLCM